MKGLSLALVVFLLSAFCARAQTPAILSEPQSITVNNASAAEFTVVASNAVAYQWFFQNTNSLPGATNASLSLDDVSSNQAGSYTVVVTSSNNVSVTSTPPAVLTIVPGTIVQLTISTYPNGGSSNFLVQLFDHDKPATVENFIHYITSGAYSNTFFDRDVTNFVLQGGDYTTTDRTTNHLQVNRLLPGTNFPAQVDSEFNVGPLIHNTFGTVAMALLPGKQDSATSAFFFNLADNSANLDTQNGGFTVFGRIIAGTNVLQDGTNILQYFNTLGDPANGIYDSLGQLTNTPVNYDGSNAPTDANLFYCDFQFISPTNPPPDTNPPVVSITFPTPNALFTNVTELIFTGTASDNVALNQVYYELYALSGLYDGESASNTVVGTANWSVDFNGFAPGIYQLTAYAQDGAGNLSAPSTVFFTNFAVLTIITNSDGNLTTNEQDLEPGPYSVTAEPGTGQRFVNWQILGTNSLDPDQSFTVETNMTLEVTYISTNLPPGLTITRPAADSRVQTTNGGLTLTGTLPSSVTVTQVTVQFYAQSNSVTAQPLLAVINGSNWTLTVSGLLGGLYSIVVTAEDSSNQQGLVSENFTALVAPPVITSQPQSVTVNDASTATFSVVATNRFSYQWELVGTGPIAGATDASLVLDDVSSNMSGSSYFVVVTSRDTQSITSAPAMLTVVPGTIIQWTVSKYADGTSNTFLVELFDHDKPVTVQNFIHYVSSGAYSNTFFDSELETSTVLIGGNYATSDRGSNALAIDNLFKGTNTFPAQVDSEFNVGPLIPNTFGTLAALGSGSPASGSSGFFFNLADNSAKFDSGPQGYTVFGRILSGTNILQYFNTLSAPTNGIYEDTSLGLTNLPVNYDGTNAPTDASVFYCDFKFQTTPVMDTNPPAVSISFPASGSVFTNSDGLIVQGTASDNIGLAEVFCVLISSTGAYNDRPQTNVAVGITNWSLNLQSLAPGIYQMTAYAQDGAGNLSAPVTESLTNLAILTIITNVDGQTTTNAPQYILPGQKYSVTAAPGPGQQFYSWTSNGVTLLNPTVSFTANGNITLIVTYLPINASPGLAITSPAAGVKALSIQYVLTASGTVDSTTYQGLTCQFFANSISISAPLAATILGTNWSLMLTNLPNGSNYTMVALATNATGGSAFATVNFTLIAVEKLTVNIVGGGTVSNNLGTYVVPGAYTLKAVPNSGQAFYSWSDGITTTLNPAKTFQLVSNLTLTATFVTNNLSLTGIAFTYPLANAMLTNGTFSIAGRLPALTRLSCQLFLQSNSFTASAQSVTVDSTGTKWTLPVSNLTAGAYTILAMGYDSKGRARLVTENFNLLAKLSVGIHGAGTVTAGLNGKYLQVGKIYPIIATPKAGQTFAYWTGGVLNSNSAATAFIMSTNTVLTATFTNNLFTGVAGTYTGLFLNPASVTASNAGFVSLTVTAAGVFSGTLKFAGTPITIFPTGFPYTGSIFLSSPWEVSNILTLAMSLDLTNGTDTITGFLADQTHTGAPLWVSGLLLNRAVTSLKGSNLPAAGNYVLLMQPENAGAAPVPSGFAAVSLTAIGNLALGGTLPDNVSISESAKISKDGIWPVFIVPSSYKGSGMLIGWQTNIVSGACDGQLFWLAPALGYATNLTSTGGKYQPPAANTQYQMVLPDATNALSVTTTGHFVAQSNIVQISLLPTGVMSGQIEVDQQKLPFKGAFISPSSGGAGFILQTNGHPDGFEILPQP